MSDFVTYINNLDLYVIVDILVSLVILCLAVAFFIHKRNVKVMALMLVLVGAYVAAQIVNEYSESQALLVTTYVLKYVLTFSLFCLAIVYQSDIKVLMRRIESSKAADLFSEGYGTDDELLEAASEIITAAQSMAKQDIGALMIITPSVIDAQILESGTTLNANLTAPLLENIFVDRSPLHDGAVVIKGNKILAAGCFLPLTQDITLPHDLGTRHRAAVGVTEENDVLAIVVSEETGIISIAKGGKLIRYMTIDKLREEIKQSFGISVVQHAGADDTSKKQKKKNRR